MKSSKKRFISIILLLAIFFSFWTVIGAISAFSGYSKLKKAKSDIQKQDLDAAKSDIKNAKNDFESSNKYFFALTPLRIIPVIGWYVADVQRVTRAAIKGLSAGETIAEAVTPYADLLGLKGGGTFLGGTAQERVANVIETLSKITPSLDKITKDLDAAREEIDKIQSWRYPNLLPGRPGEKIDLAKNTLDQVEKFTTDARPLIEVLPDIMGKNKQKKYLILFQNDKEIRPTGGFITAYAVFRVNKGNIEPENSEDIYKLDASLTKKVSAPDSIKKYLPSEPFLNIRDSNLSPDFYASMQQFQELYDFTSAPKDIDGIIAINTHFVLSMMNVLGPIEAQGTKFTTEEVDACKCPQIIFELERYADEPVAFEKGDRKGIIGVLMQQMLGKTFDAPQSSWPGLITTMLSSLQQKDIILMFKDSKSQQAIEKINFGGRLYKYDGDYLQINEANFGGAKSNMYIEQRVKQVVKKDQNKIIKKITVDYKYPRKMDNCSLERKGGLCLAGIYKSWIRFYVPLGSELIKASGTEVPITESEDLEKTVFEGFFTLRPEGTGKIELEYSIPVNPKGEYKLLMQKQSGIINQTFEIEAFGKKQKPFLFTVDKEFKVKI